MRSRILNPLVDNAAELGYAVFKIENLRVIGGRGPTPPGFGRFKLAPSFPLPLSAFVAAELDGQSVVTRLDNQTEDGRYLKALVPMPIRSYTPYEVASAGPVSKPHSRPLVFLPQAIKTVARDDTGRLLRVFVLTQGGQEAAEMEAWVWCSNIGTMCSAPVISNAMRHRTFVVAYGVTSEVYNNSLRLHLLAGSVVLPAMSSAFPDALACARSLADAFDLPASGDGEEDFEEEPTDDPDVDPAAPPSPAHVSGAAAIVCLDANYSFPSFLGAARVDLDAFDLRMPLPCAVVPTDGPAWAAPPRPSWTT